MPEICKTKFKKAQHIVEFALIAPFIIFFLGVVLEIALIVHTNYKFNSSLYEAISFMALNNKINVEKEETVKNIKEYAKILLMHRFAPYKDSLDVELIHAGDIDFIIGKYRYTSTFTLFNHMTGYKPDAYNFLSIIPVNSAILRKNSFELSNESLEKMMEVYYAGKGTAPDEIMDEDTEDTEDTAQEDITASQESASGEDDTKEIFDIYTPEVELQ